ncbi:hypothetical protein HUG17_1931 [Dermatophagoides farinae]|uniref:Uncharacterized protein n=1 Tax=Dermatophagoides farinae TaxID=6954 RepID=A0A9D4P9M2_DERFA|nr:hypothetical protein HUG17_1931 [Dermatophagoides farinae]
MCTSNNNDNIIVISLNPNHKNCIYNVDVEKKLQLSYPKILSRIKKGNDELIERWYCNDPRHIPQEFFSTNLVLFKQCIDCRESLLKCILKKCSSLESLDLRGFDMTADLSYFISKHCPNLYCLKLEFISFKSLYDANMFLYCLGNQLQHLSIDNLFLKSYFFRHLFYRSPMLNQLHLTIFSQTEDDFDSLPNAFSKLKNNLEFLSLYFFKIPHMKTIDSPHKFIDNLAISPLLHCLRFLKVKSSHHYWDNYSIIESVKKFENLLALNFNFMIYYDSKFKYNMENSWTNLKSLTLDFYLLKGSKNLLIQFLKGGYHQNLSRLRLLDLKFHPSLSKHLNGKQLLNLTRLELIDVVLKTSGLISLFSSLLSISKLRCLWIEFTLKAKMVKNIDHIQYQNDLELLYQFPVQQINLIEAFIKEHPSIESIFFIDWPGLKLDHLIHLKRIAEEKMINLTYRCYTH